MNVIPSLVSLIFCQSIEIYYFGKVYKNVIFAFVTVLYCTLLAQAQTTSEKKKIEQKMSSDPELSLILKSLKATDQDDIVSEERARRQQARQSRVAADIEAIDVDDEEV